MDKTRSLQVQHSLPGDKPSRMIPWKQALVTAFGVYPLLFSYEWLLQQFLPIHLMDRRVTLLMVVLMIAVSMVFFVMPLMVKIFGRWLYKK